MGSSQSALNFGAGPAKLPREALVEVQNELLSFEGSGMSLMEMSHRGKEYTKVHNDALNTIRDLLKVPPNYKILFLQGGATGAFAAIALNLMNRTGTADYAITGTWSNVAAKEAAKFGTVNLVFPKAAKPGSIPAESTWTKNPNASYLFYCDNETVDGVEFPYIPESSVPIVADMSSNIMTRNVDVTRFGAIIAGAQKNIGPAGVTLVIIRDDLIGNAMPVCPSIMDFEYVSKANSVHNTPVTFSVYVMGKVLQWIHRNGGVEAMQKLSTDKSTLLYDTIKNSNGFYSCPIDENCRSRINVPFRAGGPAGDEELEKKFLEEGEKLKMYQMKGHRSVGGIRISLYNAITMDEIKLLVQFMNEFRKQYGS